MDQEIKQEFEDLTLIVKEGFDSVESRMATKEDLKNFATKEDLAKVESRMATDLKALEVKMDAGFSSLWSELRAIKEKISALEKRLEKFMQTD